MRTEFRLHPISALSLLSLCTLLTGCFGMDGFQQIDGALMQRSIGSTSPTPSPTAAPTSTPTPTPAPTASPTATPSPTPSPTPLVTMDSSLTFGTALTATNNSVQVVHARSDNNALWALYADPWGVTSGTGNSSVAYSGTGTVTMSVNYTGLNDAGVNGYPFIGYGGDAYGYHNGNQAPQFPAKLNSMNALMMETNHSLTLTTAPGDLDVAYDEWLIPTSTYSGGPSGSVEVMVMFYFNFGYASSCATVKTFTETVTYNGSSMAMPFREVKCGTSGGSTYIAFFPNTNYASGDFKINLLDFLLEGAAQASVTTDWYVAGIDFGTEYGHASTVNYSMDVTKFDIEQYLK